MKKYGHILFVPFLLILASCSTDFDLTAPYKEIPIVYGLLNKDDSVQYVKINKAFLNESGSAIDAASVPDSTYYPYELDVKLFSELGNVIDSVSLYKIDMPKEPGLFGSTVLYRTPDGYKLRYSNVGKDTTWANYSIVVRRSDNSQLITRSRTGIVRDFDFSPAPFELKFVDRNTKEYLSQKLTWKSAKNGRMYNMFLRFRFREVSDVDGVSLEKYLDMPLMYNKKVNTLNGTEAVSILIDGRSFYEFVQANLDPLPTSYRREYIGPIEFHFSVAGDDFAKYIELDSSGGLNDIKPEYTNIENGMGIFSTRSKKVFKDVRQTNLSQESIEELKKGIITGNLGFL